MGDKETAKSIIDYLEYDLNIRLADENFGKTDIYDFVVSLLESLNSLRRDYDVEQETLTIREFINKYAYQNYHSFSFSIGPIVEVTVKNCEEFEKYCQSKLLDDYIVTKIHIYERDPNVFGYNRVYSLYTKPKKEIK